MRPGRVGFRAQAPSTLAALSPRKETRAGSKGSRGTSDLEMLSSSESSHGTASSGPASFIPGTPGALRVGQLCPLSDNSPQPENVNMLITKPPPQLCPPSLWLPGLAQQPLLPKSSSRARLEPAQ